LKNKKEKSSVLEKGETFEQKRNFEGVYCIPTHGGEGVHNSTVSHLLAWSNETLFT